MKTLHFLRSAAIIYSFWFCAPALPLHAQEAMTDDAAETDSATVFESLVRDDILTITIKTDQRKFLKEKKKEAYQPAIMTYADKEGTLITREIEIKSRGNMRLNNCRYPPIRLKFSKKEIKQDGLTSPHKLKLVVGCESGANYEQLVLREYLVYKLFNVFTDNSFRAQVVKLHMEDTGGKQKPRSTFAFIIEDDDELAGRIGGRVYDPKGINSKSLEPQSYNILAMFQFIAGNSDWFVLNKHNLKFVLNSEEKTVKAIPYDFDYAGIVKAPYAVANEKMPISNVQERFFIGKCGEEGYYDTIIKMFIEKKEEVLSIPKNCIYLDDNSRDWMLKFLESSYEILENPKWIQKEIQRGCEWAP